ncbi:MAG: hypothetical protein OHK0013_49380 [Sandaracinaceae bacterium]
MMALARFAFCAQLRGMRARARWARPAVTAVVACLAGCPATRAHDDTGIDAPRSEDASQDSVDRGIDGARADVATDALALEDAAPNDASLDDAAPDDGAPDACPPPTTLCGAVCADTSADPEHCGRCERRCEALPGAIAFCARGVCVPAVCRPGFGNCDGDRTNGCETAVDEDPLHCGRCERVCPSAPNAEPVCRRGACLLDCASGFEDCEPATPGCECPR